MSRRAPLTGSFAVLAAVASLGLPAPSGAAAAPAPSGAATAAAARPEAALAPASGRAADRRAQPATPAIVPEGTVAGASVGGAAIRAADPQPRGADAPAPAARGPPLATAPGRA